ncbi:PfkB family carbohydrate kinase [Georgenia sp. SUBG003]|uniref:PfkB family carbohydrate kinase n=1 Tax=Georgenia sp. SUBG003 TaxID=1497974 RepID=UPI003AB2CB9A
MSSIRVLVAGPASWNLLVRLDHLPEPRPGTHFAGGFHETVGGTSAGKAMNLARLGAEVTLRTVLGADDEGERVRAALDRYGVALLAEPAAGGRTERHVNLMAAVAREPSSTGGVVRGSSVPARGSSVGGSPVPRDGTPGPLDDDGDSSDWVVPPRCGVRSGWGTR